MSTSAAQPEIGSLIEAKDFATLKGILRAMEVHDLAELLSDLEGDELAVAFRLLSPDRAAEILAELEPEQQEALITTLSGGKVAEIVGEMAPDDRTELLEELPGQLAQRMLSGLRGEELKITRSLLAYPEDSIGRMMTPEYVAVRADWNVRRVFEHIRAVGKDKETLNVIYVVDDRWKLLDELRLEELVLAEPDETVRGLLDEQVASLSAADDQETAVELFKKYDAVALPVVDGRGILVGIVTHDDVLDVAEEEDTEDMQKMAGMAALEHSYFGTGHFGMVRKRLPWLGMLLAVETIAVIVLYQYEKYLAMLAMFMPLINATAGNTGNQIAGLMIRGFAVQEVDLADWWRVLLRELGRGVTMGVALGAMACVVVLIFGREGAIAVGDIALAAGTAMVIAVVLANVLGSMLPFFFKRVGVDPAVTSGPFIACLMDVTSILVFFSIATLPLRGLS